jgi:hypothetical protein
MEFLLCPPFRKNTEFYKFHLFLKFQIQFLWKLCIFLCLGIIQQINHSERNSVNFKENTLNSLFKIENK